MTESGAVILDGKAAARRRLEALAEEISRQPRVLTLATLQVGDHRDAGLYSKAIEGLAARSGVRRLSEKLPESASENEASAVLRRWSADSSVTGILVFLPLPRNFRTENILAAIDPSKDIEGRRRAGDGKHSVIPPTALAAVALAEEPNISMEGLEAVVVGRSAIVGKPAAMLLLDRNATVTLCHSRTRDLAAHVRRADVLIACVGRPALIRGEWIKPGAIVIDVGENWVDGKPVGDVDFEGALRRAAYLSPVPGGVGPLTNVMLIQNLLTLARASS